MIGICIAMLVMGYRADPPPPLADVSVLPALFGIGTYSFKCQYYLPGMIIPMKPKRRIVHITVNHLGSSLANVVHGCILALLWPAPRSLHAEFFHAIFYELPSRQTSIVHHWLLHSHLPSVCTESNDRGGGYCHA